MESELCGDSPPLHNTYQEEMLGFTSFLCVYIEYRFKSLRLRDYSIFSQLLKLSLIYFRHY